MVPAFEAALGYSGLVIGRECSVLSSKYVEPSSQIGWVQSLPTSGTQVPASLRLFAARRE